MMIGPNMSFKIGFKIKFKRANINANNISFEIDVVTTKPGTHKLASQRAKAFPAIIKHIFKSQCI
jgi:hypothetical protein